MAAMIVFGGDGSELWQPKRRRARAGEGQIRLALVFFMALR
jgi:hypothetical protein